MSGGSMTIEKHFLADLYLPLWRDHLRALCWAKKRKPKGMFPKCWPEWHQLTFYFQREIIEPLEKEIIGRGGLLLLVP
jgi:hypothetical protein